MEASFLDLEASDHMGKSFGSFGYAIVLEISDQIRHLVAMFEWWIDFQGKHHSHIVFTLTIVHLQNSRHHAAAHLRLALA